MRNKLFLIIALVFIGVAGWGVYLFKKPRTGLAHTTASVTISAVDLFGQYQQNEDSANKKYLDKVIAVKGTVTDVQQTDSTCSIGLAASETGGVNCGIAITTEKIIPPKKGVVITVKGRCTGFLADVNLTDCIIEPANDK